MMQRYYFSCNHVSFSNGFWVSVLRPPPQGLSVAPEWLYRYCPWIAHTKAVSQISSCNGTLFKMIV